MTTHKIFNALLLSSCAVLSACDSNQNTATSTATSTSTNTASKSYIGVPKHTNNSGSFQAENSLKNAGKTQQSTTYTIKNSQVHY